MTILIDTNVILDVLEKREPFFQDSFAVFQQAVVSKYKSLFSASSVKDIFYLVRHHTGSIETANAAVTRLLTLVNICDTTADDIKTARTFAMSDFEDAVLAATSMREKADCIITRNIKDFTGSPVKVISPADFISEKLEQGNFYK
jgi:predicted nucleic acid-binding protein